MGRRALRKIDPSLDLSGHFRLLEEMPPPFDAEALFGRRAPLEIEVGSGKGLFLAGAAEQHPERNFLGIEVARKYARFAAARLAKAELPNAVMLHGDGLQFFDQHLADNSIDAVHVYFPDPWWKKRHRQRRVMNEAFLKNIQCVLIDDGALHFWTDVEEYFQTTLELIAEVTDFVGPIDVPPRAAEHDLDYRTHFERRMRLSGLPVYRSEFRKQSVTLQK